MLVAVDRSSVGNHAFGVMRGHPNKFDCMQAHTLREGGQNDIGVRNEDGDEV